jgi:hypothetical protein
MFYVALIAPGLAGTALCQEIPQIEPTQAYPNPGPESSAASQHESRHILGVIPNYKISPNFDHYEPLTRREKFKIASEDTLDPGTFAVSAVFGGLGQIWLGNSTAVAISKCLLPGSPGCWQLSIETGHADRPGYGWEHSEGILAGSAAQIQQKVVKQTSPGRSAMKFSFTCLQQLA